jgi:DNA-binding NarL/FixJ family response regulator
LIRLLVVTPALFYSEALTVFLGSLDAVEIVGAATSAEEARNKIGVVQPDMVLLDAVVVPAPAVATKLLSEVGFSFKLIVLAIPETPELVVRWAEAGACGYIPSDTPLHQLLPIIESAARGEVLCSAHVAGALLRRLQRSPVPAPRPDDFQLTARERQVIEHVARGLSNKEIARALGISLATVKNHVHNIFDKLQVHRRADALSLDSDGITSSRPRHTPILRSRPSGPSELDPSLAGLDAQMSQRNHRAFVLPWGRLLHPCRRPRGAG